MPDEVEVTVTPEPEPDPEPDTTVVVAPTVIVQPSAPEPEPAPVEPQHDEELRARVSELADKVEALITAATLAAQAESQAFQDMAEDDAPDTTETIPVLDDTDESGGGVFGGDDRFWSGIAGS